MPAERDAIPLGIPGLCNREQAYFEAEKEERISRLRNLLGVSNLTPEQEYEINTKLYEEFRKYKLDSAIRYVERNLEIARQLDNKRLTYLSNM